MAVRIPRRRVHRGLGPGSHTNQVAVVFKGTDQVPGGVRRALWAWGGAGRVLMEGFTKEVILELRCRVECEGPGRGFRVWKDEMTGDLGRHSGSTGH